MNVNIFKLDDLEQYKSCENLRIHSVVESSERKYDSEDVVRAVAEELNVEIRKYDAQRAHIVGVKKTHWMINLDQLSFVLHLTKSKTKSSLPKLN